jgi:hypothetical protein
MMGLNSRRRADRAMPVSFLYIYTHRFIYVLLTGSLVEDCIRGVVGKKNRGHDKLAKSLFLRRVLAPLFFLFL